MSHIDAIIDGWKRHILNQKPTREVDDERDKRNYFYAGSWRPCLRRMVLEATHPSYFPDYDVESKARFIRGDQREIDLRQALERVGQLCMPSFTVEGQQEHIWLMDHKGRKVISGKKDCSIRWESRERWSVEFKSWSTFLTDKIFKFADLLNSPYTKSGAKQLLAYLYAKNEPFGLLVLDRPGLPRLIPVPLEEHLELMEEFLADAECGRDHIEAGTLPDFHDDPDECKRCPVFGSHCNPALKFGGATVISDEVLLAALERREELKEAAAEYAVLDDTVKESFRNIPMAIAGKFMISGKPRKVTKYVFPSEQEKKRFQVSDPNGGWTTSIVKVSE